MPTLEKPRSQNASDTAAGVNALRASLTELVQGGHGDDLLDLRPDGSFATTPAPRPATGLVGRFKAAFSSLRDVFRRSERTASQPSSSGRFSTLHVLYSLACEHHGKAVAQDAIVSTPLAQRNVTIGDTRRISVSRAMQLLDEADRKAAETGTANTTRVDALLQPPRAAVREALAAAGWASGAEDGEPDPALGRFVDAFVRRRAADHPEFRRGALKDEELAGCCADAARLLVELAEASGPELPALLDRVLNDPNACASSAGMAQAARSKVIESAFERMSSAGGDSVLWTAVLEESARLARQEGPVDAGDTRMLEMIGKEISKEMQTDFAHRAHALVEHLGLPPDTPVARVLEKCQGRLVQNIQTAVREHFQALEMIAKDKDLNPEQRQVLESLARTRRLDPVQVDQLKWFGATLGKSIHSMGRHATRGRPEPMFDRLKIANDAFGTACQEMGRHAETMWVAHAFDDAVARDQLFGVGIQLAIAGKYADREEARFAFEALIGTGEGETDDGSSPAGSLSPLAAVQLVMQACDQGGSTQIGDMKSRYAAVVIELARRAGVVLDEVVERKTVQVRKAAGLVEETIDVTREEQLMARLAGERQPLSEMPVGILAQTLLDVPHGEFQAVRSNGVLAGGRAAEAVAPEFDATQVFLQAGPTHATTGVTQTPHGPLATSFVDAIDRLDILVDGVPLSGTRDERIQGFFEKTAGSGDAQMDQRIALEISRRMNPMAMRRWTADLEHAALNGQGASLEGVAPLRCAFELGSDAQGNWSLAAIVVSAPETLVLRDAPDGADRPVPVEGGVIVSRLRSTIPAASIQAGEPVVAQRDALVTFAF